MNLPSPNVQVNVDQHPVHATGNTQKFDLYHLAKEFKENRPEPFTWTSMLDFCTNEMRWIDETDGEVLPAAKKGTLEWKAAVKGRITEKFVHSAQATSLRHTNDFLVSKIVGYGARVTRSETLSQNFDLRGFEKILESLREMWSQPEHNVRRCGLFLRSEYPTFAATADAICEQYVYKIIVSRSDLCIRLSFDNCLSFQTTDSQTTFKRLNAGKFSENELHELNFIMHMTRRKRMYICVVHYNYPITKLVNTISLEYDMAMAQEVLVDAQNFWNREVFPIVIKA